MALEITKENFEEIVKNNKLVVVDFWAPWCGPCRMVAPIIEELAEDFKDKGVAIGKINTDEQQELAIQFGIRSIPTVLFIKDGEVVDSMIGAAPKNFYEEKINALLN
jgi:thioredoxin 1